MKIFWEGKTWENWWIWSANSDQDGGSAHYSNWSSVGAKSHSSVILLIGLRRWHSVGILPSDGSLRWAGRNLRCRGRGSIVVDVFLADEDMGQSTSGGSGLWVASWACSIAGIRKISWPANHFQSLSTIIHWALPVFSWGSSSPGTFESGNDRCALDKMPWWKGCLRRTIFAWFSGHQFPVFVLVILKARVRVFSILEIIFIELQLEVSYVKCCGPICLSTIMDVGSYRSTVP